MSSKGAKRSRRVAGDAPEAPTAGGEGGARGGGPASAASSAASAASTALVRSRLRSSAAAAADDEGSAGGALAVGITVADVSRIVEEKLRAVQCDHARELAAVNRELAAVRRNHSRLSSELSVVRSDHALLASEVADLRYDNSHLCTLVKSSIDHTEVDLAMVCRRFGSGPDAFREYRSVMSVLFNLHAYDLSEGFMRFFTTLEACELRLVHSEFLDAVTATPWHDIETVITGPLVAWRACFPDAEAASVLGRGDLRDADYAHLRGLRFLNMGRCKGVSAAAFVNLRGIDSLTMWFCNQPGITARAFTHLKGIQELAMEGCSLAVTTVAFILLQGARSLVVSPASNPYKAAIQAADVPECRRLLAARALGSACWLYAGVAFHDLPAPASVHDVIATMCTTLLQVATDVESKGMVLEATKYVVDASFSILGGAAMVSAGAIPALVAALDRHGADNSVGCNACAALRNIARTDVGRVACGAAGAARPIVSTLRLHATSVVVVEQAFYAVASMTWNSSANVASFVSLGAVSCIVAAFEACAQTISLCRSFSWAICNIAHYPCGVEACLAAGAVPLLAAAYAKDEPARVHAEKALRFLGYDSRGVLLVRK